MPLTQGTAIDISNYTGKLEFWDLDWLQGNSDLVIVRLSTEDGAGQRDIAAQQVSALGERGIPWQGYLWCYWDQHPASHWERATELLPAGWPGYYGRNIWLDMEDDVTPGVRALDWVTSYAWLLEGEDFAPGLYTGAWWIRKHSAAFQPALERHWARFPLWNANYNGNPSCGNPGLPIWGAVAMHQYESVGQGPVLGSYDRSLICHVE